MNGTKGSALFVATLLSVAGAACSSTATAPEDIPDLGVVHVHGLGVDPADGVLYAATHTGLFRINDSGEAQRVGDLWHDLMGFTVVGPNHFVASGHPDLRTDLPPLMGLVESRDAGATWTSRSLIGEADFHALEATEGWIYAYDGTTGRFMASADGRRWSVLSRPGSLFDFAVSPRNPQQMVAVGDGGMLRTTDGGQTWRPVGDAPPGLLTAWSDEAWVVSPDGTVSSSADGGVTWRERGAIPSGDPEAFAAVDDMLYVAVSDAGIFRSSDGATWDAAYSA